MNDKMTIQGVLKNAIAGYLTVEEAEERIAALCNSCTKSKNLQSDISIKE